MIFVKILTLNVCEKNADERFLTNTLENEIFQIFFGSYIKFKNSQVFLKLFPSLYFYYWIFIKRYRHVLELADTL